MSTEPLRGYPESIRLGVALGFRAALGGLSGPLTVGLHIEPIQWDAVFFICRSDANDSHLQ